MVATAVTIFAYLPRSSCECPFMQATYLPTNLSNLPCIHPAIHSFKIEEKPQRWMHHHHTSQPARVSADNFSTCDALLLLSWMAWCEHLPARNMIPVHQPSATASIAREKREATRPPNCQPAIGQRPSSPVGIGIKRTLTWSTPNIITMIILIHYEYPHHHHPHYRRYYHPHQQVN